MVKENGRRKSGAPTESRTLSRREALKTMGSAGLGIATAGAAGGVSISSSSSAGASALRSTSEVPGSRKKVMTVNGPIAPEELGFTAMHEHLLADFSIYLEEADPGVEGVLAIGADDPIRLDNLAALKTGGFFVNRDSWDLSDEKLIQAEVSDYKKLGGGALLDLTAQGCRPGYYAPGLRRISQQTGVHIIATTGLYAAESWPERFKKMSVDSMVKAFRKDIEEGIEGTDIRAGGIKAGPNYFREPEQRMVKACARTSRDTGLMFTMHTVDSMTWDENWEMGQLMLREGANPEKIVMAHVGNSLYPKIIVERITSPSKNLNLDVAKRLMDTGFNISLDTFGLWIVGMERIGKWFQTDEVLLSGLVQLINAGYSKQIVIGHDTFLKLQLRRHGGYGLTRILDFVVPTLKQAEISDSDIHNVTVANPARLLAP